MQKAEYRYYEISQDLPVMALSLSLIHIFLGNYETTLHSYFLPGDIDWYGCRWTDVHCFSIVDCRWHYSIGDVTFIIDQEEKTNGI